MATLGLCSPRLGCNISFIHHAADSASCSTELNFEQAIQATTSTRECIMVIPVGPKKRFEPGMEGSTGDNEFGNGVRHLSHDSRRPSPCWSCRRWKSSLDLSCPAKSSQFAYGSLNHHPRSLLASHGNPTAFLSLCQLRGPLQQQEGLPPVLPSPGADGNNKRSGALLKYESLR